MEDAECVNDWHFLDLGLNEVNFTEKLVLPWERLLNEDLSHLGTAALTLANEMQVRLIIYREHCACEVDNTSDALKFELGFVDFSQHAEVGLPLRMLLLVDLVAHEYWIVVDQSSLVL